MQSTGYKKGYSNVNKYIESPLLPFWYTNESPATTTLKLPRSLT